MTRGLVKDAKYLNTYGTLIKAFASMATVAESFERVESFDESNQADTLSS